MYCTSCGDQLRENDRFCSQCGNPMAADARHVAVPPPLPERQLLMLDKGRKKVAGVCAGFARYFGVDLVLMRVLWMVLAICTGVGFIAYIVAWIVVPSDLDYAPSPGYPQRI